jgi:hypothetical protein
MYLSILALPLLGLDLSQGAFEAIASQEEGKVSTLLFVLFFLWRY